MELTVAVRTNVPSKSPPCQVIVQIESEDGAILAVMKNAMCLALMDAGVPMRSMFAGVSCVQQESGELTWDPTAEEEEESTAKYTFVYENSKNNAIYVHCTGESTIEQYVLALQKSRQVANEVFAFYRESFEKLLRKDVKFQMLLPPIIKGELLEEPE
jgi:exosome complex component RRP46